MAIVNQVSNQTLLTSSSPTFSALTTANLSLDVTANSILSLASNNPIALIPNGTGPVIIGNATSPHSSPASLWLNKGGYAPALGLSSYVNSTSASVEYFFKSRSTTIGSFTTVQSGDTIGNFLFYGDDGTQFSQVGQMTVQSFGTISSGIVPGQMQWLTSNSSGVLTPGMILTDAQVLQVPHSIYTPSILDSNDNTILNFTTEATSVNYLNIYNAASGSGVTVAASGSDTNINLSLGAKGTGIVEFNSQATSSQYQFSSGTTFVHTTLFSFPTSSNVRTLTFADSSGSMGITPGSITSGNFVSYTGTAGLIQDSGVSSTAVITTIDGDSGSVTPSSGVVTISGGTTGLTTSGSSATLNLTGTLKLANGGTNASLTASNGGIFYSTASAGAILAGTATAHQILMSGASTTPAWSTATYPVTVTSGNILYASGSNVVGQITSGTGVVAALGRAVTGSNSIVLSSGATISEPIIDQINDTGGDIVLSFYSGDPGASPNSLGLFNGVSGSPPEFLAQGSDTNVGMQFTTQAAGTFLFQAAATSAQIVVNSGSSLQHTTTWSYPGTSASRTITIPDATGTMQLTGATSLITAPAASQASSLSLGSAYVNPFGYDVVITVYIGVTSATSATISLGVGSTNTPTQQTIVSGLTLASLSVITVPIYLPTGYYALLSTGGTITASISGQQAMPV